MTFTDQSAIIRQAFENQLLKHEDIIRWADTAIVEMKEPPAILIELSMLPPANVVEMASYLRALAPIPVPMRRQIQLIVLAHHSGLLSFDVTVSKLFEVAINGQSGHGNALDERLLDALVEWDCQEDLDTIEQPLRAKFTALFQEYLNDVDDIAALLPWKFARIA
jgi:hypothetical protein